MSGCSCGQIASAWARRLRTIDSSAICSACGLRIMRLLLPAFALEESDGGLGFGLQAIVDVDALPARRVRGAHPGLVQERDRPRIAERAQAADRDAPVGAAGALVEIERERGHPI